eukprot:gene3920-4289_t
MSRQHVILSYDTEPPEPLRDCARIPSGVDNAAIAIRRLEAGHAISHEGKAFTLSHTVLEAHRFVPVEVPAGAPLTSWGLPFGTTIVALKPGDYLANDRIIQTYNLQAMAIRKDVDFTMPRHPNFKDAGVDAYSGVDPSKVVSAPQVTLLDTDETFDGFDRGARGVGTRSCVILVGVTSLAAPFVRVLGESLRGCVGQYSGSLDAVVPVAHTEGEAASLNNRDLLLRTLSGFLCHPNVAGALIIQTGNERHIGADTLLGYMRDNGYPVDLCAIKVHTLSASFQHEISVCSDKPVSAMRLALQCGGSDAFSGITGNPLSGLVARHLIRRGGAAVLAETPELVGAESYVVSLCQDSATAGQFIDTIE